MTCNATRMANNFARVVLFGPQEYQGIGVKQSILPPGNHIHYRIFE